MIALNNVFYSYNPKSQLEVKVLDNLNFQIQENKMTAIVGKTGCGKSTFVQMLNGLYFPTCGTIKVDEFILSNKRKERSKKINNLKKKVGLVFQFSENQLFEETIEKDVAFGPMNFKTPKDEALKIARECLLEVGLDESFFKRSPFEISGGEKRKVAIAGILALKPDYLVLDEPTVGLDNESIKWLFSLLKKLKEKGTTIIFVTHDLNLVLDYADEIVVLKDKKSYVFNSSKELFNESVSKYDLVLPDLIRLGFLLKEKGLNINIQELNSIDNLCEQIKRSRR